jgi:hypothetical protein
VLYGEIATHTDDDPSNAINNPENWYRFDVVRYHTLTSRAKQSSNRPLSFCSWGFGIFDDSQRYKTIINMGWQIAINVRFGFNLPVPSMLGFHSLYDRW